MWAMIDNILGCKRGDIVGTTPFFEWAAMDQDRFFETVIEPGVQRLGLFGVAHDVHFDGRNFVVLHKVSKNVFTEFDSKLSRYLAAVKGRGLPMATVQTSIRDVGSGRSWTPYAPRHTASVPHALAVAARLALGSEQAADVRVGAWVNEENGTDEAFSVSRESIEMLERGLEICRMIGTVDFLEISGDFERVLARPMDSKMDMVVIDLARGMLSIPTVSELGGSAWQGPIYGFEKAISQAPAIMSFLARARHAVAMCKEDAIHNFREAAETRILSFNEALANRPLAGYRLEAATSLVSRLQAGLGDTLLGLSEAAQMTALDWAVQVRDMPADARAKLVGNTDEIRPRLVK